MLSIATEPIIIFGDKKSIWKRKFASTFIVAVFVFVLINCFVENFASSKKISSPIDISSSDKELKTIGKLGSWWLAKAYFADPTPPDVVVLGSSQLGALQGADAYVLDRRVDITGDHRSYVLEGDLLGFLNQRWKVLVGGLPGMMISDQLVVSRALFSKEYKPKLVAICFSPRDFIDNTCPSPIRTEPYAFFSKYAHLESVRNLFPSDFEFSRPVAMLPLRSHSRDLCPDAYIANSEKVQLLGMANPFERIRPDEIIITSGSGYFSCNNTAEYKRRYKNPVSPRLKLNLLCLDALLSYLAQNNIKAIAFSLPLSNENKQLLPDSFWQLYNQQITEVCKKNGADWININSEVKGFEDKEFVDGVHLNLFGGHRLASTLALYIANKFHWRTFAELESDEKKLL